MIKVNNDSVNTILDSGKRIIDKYRIIHEERFNSGLLYNVFSEIGVSNMELQHSAFIASLLNPKGNHGASDKFLKGFLSILRNLNSEQVFCKNTDELDYQNAQIKIEKDIGLKTNNTGGRIDIFIELQSISNSSIKYAIAIENKIYAEDQASQLFRYKNFLDEHYKNRNLLLYLTLNGRAPSEKSKNGLQDSDFLCISYREFINDWLSLCLKESANLPLIRETLVQYINLIKKLTFQEMPKMEENDLINLLLEKDNLFIAEQIQGVIPKAKEDFFAKHLNNWIKDIAKDYNLEYRNILDNGYYRNYGPFCILHSDTAPYLKNFDIKIGFQRNNYENMYIQAELKPENRNDNNLIQITKEKEGKDIIWKDVKDYCYGFFFNDKLKKWNSEIISESILDGGKAFKEELKAKLENIIFNLKKTN